MQMLLNKPARQLSIRKIADYLKSQQLTASREYIADYGPKARVVLPNESKKGWCLVKIADLFPYKYEKKSL